MTTENVENDDAVETAAEEAQTTNLTVSQVVCAAREEKGLSQKEVADQLFLTTTFIRYIDEGDFARIPKPAFIKGYLRSYARVVGLDGDALVRLYEEGEEEKHQKQELKDVTEETVGPSNFTGPVMQTALGGLAGVIVLVVVVWWLAAGEEEPVPVVTQPGVTSEDPEPPTANPSAPDLMDAAGLEAEADDAGLDVAEPELETAAAEVAEAAILEPANVDNDSVVTPPEEERTVTGEPEATEPDVVPEEALAGPAPTPTVTGGAIAVDVSRFTEGDNRFITVDAGGFDELELRFSGECWVEITNGEGAALYGDLNRAADVMRVLADTPLNILLGKATVVELDFNGEAVDLSPFTSGEDTARLTLNP